MLLWVRDWPRHLPHPLFSVPSGLDDGPLERARVHQPLYPSVQGMHIELQLVTSGQVHGYFHVYGGAQS